MLTVRMDADVPRAFRTQQMHGVGDHDRAFVEMMLMGAIGLPDAIPRRLERRNKVLEVQIRLPDCVSVQPVATTIDSPL